MAIETSAGLRVSKKRLEAVIHVLLDVAVKQSKPWLIGCEIDNGPPIIRNDHRILDYAGGLLPVDFSQFPKMAVQVHRMSIVGAIAHHQPIARASLQYKLPLVRIWLAVDQPQVELTCSSRHFVSRALEVPEPKIV